MADLISYDFRGRTELDETNVEEVGSELLELAREGGGTVVLNLSSVKCLTSTHLAKLIILHKRVRSAGGQLRLWGLHPNLIEVFSITQLDKVFRICKDESEALASVSEPSEPSPAMD